jgi:predicted O-methyltransferase YrrM
MRDSATTLQPELTANELATILDVLKTGGLRGPHLEIGTAAGGTLREMMAAYPSESRPRFVVVDPFTYFPDQRAIVERNLRGAGLDPAEVDFRVGFSWPALKEALARPERFSFIFVDGNHRAKYVMQDLAWARLLDVGGYVCLHDYKPKFRGVIWATERFLTRHPNYRRVAHVDSLVVLRKEAPARRPEVTALDIRLGAALETVHRWRWSVEKRLPKAGAARP